MRIRKMLNSVICCILMAGSISGYGMGLDEIPLKSNLLGPRTEKINFDNYTKIFYVSHSNGSDKDGAGSKNSPWKTIGFALNQTGKLAKQGRYALLIAEGRYAEKTIVMQKHIDLFGGFSANSWQRDIFDYQTLLDGQGVRRVILAADSARIDGFVITNGMANSHGAGLLCDDTSPEISNNFIKGNTILGPTSFNTTRIHQEGNQGAGIACRFNAIPVIRNNLIFQNRTAIGNGAGIAFYGWVRKPGIPEYRTVDNRISGSYRATVMNNVIMFNKAGVDDLYRTRSSNGGGISVAFEARPMIMNNLVAMNDAGGRGDAGGIYIEYFADPDIIGNWILGNTSDDDGGGLYTMRLGQPLIEGNIFSGNYTRSGGAGAIRVSKEGRATIKSNLMVQNPGGGVTSVDSYVEMSGNIITDNPGRPGVSISSKFTYFRPSMITGNFIFDNPEGNINIVDSYAAVSQDHGDPQGITVVGGAPLNIREMKSDAAHFCTIIIPENISDLSAHLVGKVIHIGETWSLVKSVTDTDMTVWGDVTAYYDRTEKLEFLPIYETKR